MPSIPLTTQDPGEFAYTDGQTFYNEKLAHEILKHAADMAAEGYEITFEEADSFDYTNLWNAQNFALSALSAALTGYENIEEFEGFYGSYANQLAELATLPYSKENYALRSAAIDAIAAFVGGNTGEIDTSGIVASLEKFHTLLSETDLTNLCTVEIDTSDIVASLEKFHTHLSDIVASLEKFHTHLSETDLTNLWTAQNAIIQEQSEYLAVLKQQLQEKEDKLPGREDTQSFLGMLWSTFLEEGIEETIYTLIVGLLRYIFTMGDVATKVVAFLSIVALLAIKDLIDQYTKGKAICDRYIDENAQLLGIEKSEYAYELRLKIIKNHNDHIANLLSDIHKLEETASQNNNGDMAELVQAVKDLSMTGYEIEAEDFRIRKLGQTLTSGSW